MQLSFIFFALWPSKRKWLRRSVYAHDPQLHAPHLVAAMLKQQARPSGDTGSPPKKLMASKPVENAQSECFSAAAVGAVEMPTVVHFDDIHVWPNCVAVDASPPPPTRLAGLVSNPPILMLGILFCAG